MIKKQMSHNFNKYGVTECYESIFNDTKVSVLLEGIHMELTSFFSSQITSLTYYKGGWGNEFQEERFDYEEGQIDFYIENTKGRSSHEYHPFFILEFVNGGRALLGYAWSGNWYFRMSQYGEVFVGQSERMFTKELKDGEEFKSPSVLFIYGDKSQKSFLSSNFHQFLRENWIPNNQLSKQLFVEWNHWWTYEDMDINEEIFIKNADTAKELGIELCTLDSGWYGDSSITWSRQQGDWHLINREKFPKGIRYLSDYVHSKGMKFGIWMEPEALGLYSNLRKEHPDIEGMIDGKSYDFPYICLGNPKGESILYEMMVRVIEETKADFIKLDFNLDPEYGCNKLDHGHGAGDGLYEHYMAYYRILDRIQNEYPNLIIENCASGGLRCDFGILKHVHTTFLSDVDVTKHSLESFYQLSHFVPPSSILHWAWSETRRGEEGGYAFPSFLLEEADEVRIKLIIRAAMLHQMGFSRNLSDMKEEYKGIWKEQIAFYKSEVRAFLSEGQLFHLMKEDEIICIQLQMEGKALVFCFFYGKKEAEPFRLRLVSLDESESYMIKLLDRKDCVSRTGRECMEEGIYLEGFSGMSSEILVVEKEKR